MFGTSFSNESPETMHMYSWRVCILQRSSCLCNHIQFVNISSPYRCHIYSRQYPSAFW